MKIKLITSTLILTGAMMAAMPASANILAQRNCSPGDINFASPQTTTCTWKANDDNAMQITFHGAPNKEKAHVVCNFNPAGSNDKITGVVAKKAAEVTSLNNDGKNLNFNVRAPANGDNANVLFYVNSGTKGDYTAGATLTCSTEVVPPVK